MNYGLGYRLDNPNTDGQWLIKVMVGDKSTAVRKEKCVHWNRKTEPEERVGNTDH
jgi:hypothetical protein